MATRPRQKAYDMSRHRAADRPNDGVRDVGHTCPRNGGLVFSGAGDFSHFPVFGANFHIGGANFHRPSESDAMGMDWAIVLPGKHTKSCSVRVGRAIKGYCGTHSEDRYDDKKPGGV